MTERLPENVPPAHQETGWWYIEFRGFNQQNGAPLTNPTPGAPAGTSNPGGIASAQTWLTETNTAGTNPVFGMIDGGGTVRLFWHGTRLFP
jgi:hypothetical protein